MLEGLKESNIVTIEDNMLIGGFGSMIASYYSDSKRTVKIFAYKDKFIEHGNIDELMDSYGLDVNEIVAYIKTLI